MTDGEFPFRSFTMRSEGYDSGEVDSYVEDLQREIVELRRALETATPSDSADARLHDPEGAVTRTLAIAQETADRVLHDAQVEADRRRSEADEHATTTVAEADERAARLLADMEAQAAEVREQGVAAARSAIQVERDKAMAELAHVRRVRDDLRTEAVDLKAALDQYRSQAREASDTLAAASSGPLMSLDLPDFIDDDVVLAGISSTVESNDGEVEGEVDEDIEVAEMASDDQATEEADDADESAEVDMTETVQMAAAEETMTIDDAADAGFLRAVDTSDGDDETVDGELADVISIGTDQEDEAEQNPGSDDGDFGGTFLAEVRAAAQDDDVALAPENDDVSDDGGSDRFLSELRGLADEGDEELDSDAADLFFDNE